MVLRKPPPTGPGLGTYIQHASRWASFGILLEGTEWIRSHIFFGDFGQNPARLKVVTSPELGKDRTTTL